MSNAFLQFFSDPAPVLRVKFRQNDQQAKTVPVQHKLGGSADAASSEYLKLLREFPALSSFCEFFGKHDGAQLCRTHDARFDRETPLLDFKSAKRIANFTSRYMPDGDRAWTIDLNKSKALYRGGSAWIVFAEIDSGPMGLAIFLEGENAGNIYLIAPQPEFNILRPIAKGFQPLLERIGKDLPAFLRLVRASVSLRGADGHNYGFQAVEYSGNGHDERVYES